ncbi:MAG: helix-turn-helix domain-containing protein [Bacteroidales bacterium]|nr:helix-turn-helix domain-containing protein [Bacteroidales bacterium]
MKRLSLILIAVLTAACSRSTGGGAERFPDLPQPLHTVCAITLNGELTLFGGHTDGFLPSPSTWYLKDGTWHDVPMKYPHDHGFFTLLPDGKVMLGGGSAEAFGIGQSWGVEVYDPSSHSFTPIGVLDRKRAGASALALPDGRVLVSGNWYAPDAMEIYEPGKGFSFLKDVTAQRNTPFILASSEENAIIFSGRDNYGNPSDGTVDRLNGDPFHEPLLDEWECVSRGTSLSIGEYAFLVLARHRERQEWGILHIEGEHFSLLETDQPLPACSEAGDYVWCQLAVDRSRRSAYSIGFDPERNVCVARICYDPIFDGDKAEVTLTEIKGSFPQPDAFVLLPDGTIVLPGGNVGKSASTHNFITSREIWAFRTEARSKSVFPWPWILAICLLLLSAGAILIIWKKDRSVPVEGTEGTPVSLQLTEQLAQIIEKEELFKQPDLRVTDIAARLATNRTYISAIIKSLSGDNFSNMINGYRVRYAQKLMKDNPQMSVTEIAVESGFSSRSAFYRNFKEMTGLNPAEWKKSLGG